MTADERVRIEAKVRELRLVIEADDGQDNQKARLALVANMLMAYPMAGGSEESGRARATAYLSALDDVPPWAIADAVRRWHRGEGGGKDANYRFAPAPAELRYSAMQILQPGRQTVAHLQNMLDALSLQRAMDPAPVEDGRAIVPRLRAV